MLCSVFRGLRRGHALDVGHLPPPARAVGHEAAVALNEAAAHQRVHRHAPHLAPREGRDLAAAVQSLGADDLAPVQIHRGVVGVHAGLDAPLRAGEAEGARRGLGRQARVVLERQPPARDLRQHQRQLRLDAGKAAIGVPDDGPRLLLGRVRRVVGGDHVHHAGAQRRPDRRAVGVLAHGRVDADDGAEARAVAGVEQEVAGAGLARDVHAAALGVGEGHQFCGRGDVQHVDARAGPFGKRRRAPHGLDRDDRRPRVEVRERVGAPRRHQVRLATRHDGGRLGVQRDPQAVARDDLEPLQHRARGGRGQVAEGVAHEALEGVGAGRDQPVELAKVVLREQAVEAEIHAGFPRRLLLRTQLQGRARGRVRVGHLEHGRRAAHGGGAGAPILLVGVARLAEMHVHVDGAGEEVEARDVHHLLRLRQRRAGREQRLHQPVPDRHVGAEAAAAVHDGAAAQQQVRHSAAHPPSTGRSAPVICRAASEARKTQALATSASVLTRRSA